MKNLILLSASLLVMSASLTAQEVVKTPKQEKPKATNEKTAEQRAQKHVDGIGNEIAITTEQKTKIYDFALTKAKNADEIRRKYMATENKDGLQAELDANKREYRKKVKGILTPEQLETLKVKHQEMKKTGKTTSLDQD